LPARERAEARRQSGELAGHRWRIDVAPMMRRGETAGALRPLAVNMRCRRPAAAIQVTTVRLVPRGPNEGGRRARKGGPGFT
jgi:general secretion pathway protein I